MEEKTLILEAKNGNMHSFEKLIELHQRKIYLLAFRYVNNREDAEDIVQDVVLKIYNNLSKFDFKAAFPTWVYRITQNTALDYIRKYKNTKYRETNIEDISFSLGTDIINPEEEAVKRMKLREMIGIINSLDENFRQVIILRELNGYSYDEIADILDISVGTVKSRLSRAREAIRSRFYK